MLKTDSPQHHRSAADADFRVRISRRSNWHSRPYSRLGMPLHFPPGAAEEVTKRIAALPAAITGKHNPECVEAALVLAVHGQWRRFDAMLRLLDQDWRHVLVAGDPADADWPTRLDAELPDR
jgi:hypothetical protein